jgi:hypothetical protein
MTEPDKMTDPVERARYWKLRALAAEGQVKSAAGQPAQEPHDNKADVSEPHPMLSATHFCLNCRALWRQCDDFTFNLRSTQCCDKCNNAPVGGQLVPLYTAHPMRCGKCGVEFSDRQPGTLCPKCYIELEASQPAQEPALRVVVSVDDSGALDRHHFDMTWLQTPIEAGEYLYYAIRPASAANDAAPLSDKAKQDRIMELAEALVAAAAREPIEGCRGGYALARTALETEVRKP